jgi:DNA-binding CsgD family transcriptional regulator
MPENDASHHDSDRTIDNPELGPVFDTAPAGLYRSRVSDGCLLRCNQRLAEMLGYDTVKECIDEYCFAEHYCDPHRRAELLRLLRQHGQVSDFDAELMRADGKKISVIFNAKLFEQGGYLEGVMIDVTARQRALDDLRNEQQAVQAKSIALREVLDQTMQERQRIATAINENYQRNVLPVLDRIRERVDGNIGAMLDALQRELEEITAPFTDRLGKQYHSLTPTEIRICNHIRRGLSTKQIAEAEGITAGTVSVHREHIRRKLELTNTKINLTTYLRSLAEDLA